MPEIIQEVFTEDLIIESRSPPDNQGDPPPPLESLSTSRTTQRKVAAECISVASSILFFEILRRHEDDIASVESPERIGEMVQLTKVISTFVR
jgi:hypothetical protein